MNTTFTIEIKAPELAEALNNIAHVIAITVSGMDAGQDVEPYSPCRTVQQVQQQTPVAPVIQQPVQQAPIQQQQPVQQVPTQQYAAPTVQQAPTQQIPTQAQSYTMDQLAIAATQLMDAGKRNELVGLLGQFGVQALTELPKEQYGAFATALRGMGARI